MTRRHDSFIDSQMVSKAELRGLLMLVPESFHAQRTGRHYPVLYLPGEMRTRDLELLAFSSAKLANPFYGWNVWCMAFQRPLRHWRRQALRSVHHHRCAQTLFDSLPDRLAY